MRRRRPGPGCLDRVLSRSRGSAFRGCLGRRSPLSSSSVSVPGLPSLRSRPFASGCGGRRLDRGVAPCRCDWGAGRKQVRRARGPIRATQRYSTRRVEGCASMMTWGRDLRTRSRVTPKEVRSGRRTSGLRRACEASRKEAGRCAHRGLQSQRVIRLGALYGGMRVVPSVR